MSRVILKKKKLKTPEGMDDKNIAEMFNQMLGTGDIDIAVAYPRYIRMRDIIMNLTELMKVFNNSPMMTKNRDFTRQHAEFAKFIADSEREIPLRFSEDLTQWMLTPKSIPEERRKQFTTVYEGMKRSDLIATYIMVCDSLLIYKEHLSGSTPLTDNVILNAPVAEICPFRFSSFNLKYAFNTIKCEVSKQFILLFLSKLYQNIIKLYKEMNTPDIDIDDFVKVIGANIGELRKIPALHRCNKAISRIEASLNMLKDNFNQYYRDFVQTKNPTIMMEHFIIDVSKNTDADLETTRQFRKIIEYYKKLVAEQSHDPKLKSLFDQVGDKLNVFDKTLTGENASETPAEDVAEIECE